MRNPQVCPDSVNGYCLWNDKDCPYGTNYWQCEDRNKYLIARGKLVELPKHDRATISLTEFVRLDENMRPVQDGRNN